MLRTAVDIGGTFTDVVTFDQEAGTIAVEKTPSTPDNPAQGVINGLQKAEVDMSDVDFFSHGSTVGTNALIERELPRIGLVTTEGFRDVHEIRDSTKDHLWDAYETVAPPYVNREDRFEVSERVDYRGEVVEPLDRTQARTVAKRLRKRNIRTVAVVFVNAHMNGDHEREVAEIVRAEHPDAFVCTSNEIMAKLGEHPRTSTTVINAALVPVVREYLTDLADRLGRMGYDNNVLAMHSGGGVMTADAIAYYAARIANSGPTAGAIASTFIAEQCDFRNVIGFDMGGTSTDVSLTYRGAIEMTNEWAVESGYPINFPSTDIETIGAGGGSIAWIDRGGSLRVGPQSQGADPGPACYQRGGDRPTITDANVLLNWLSPDSFIGGDMEASSEPSREAIERRIADPLGLDPIEAAMAIEEIGLASMGNAVRLISTRKGIDPRDFALVAFGGAGPVHAPFVARQMNIPTVIVPPHPGINSALGCLLVDVEHDLSKTFIADADADVVGDVEAEFRGMESKIRDRLVNEGVDDADVRIERELRMRYRGQWRSLDVSCARPLTELETVQERFHTEHDRMFDYLDRDNQVTIHALQVTGIGPVEKPSLPPIDTQGTADSARTGTREAYFAEYGEFVDTPVYRRESLGANTSFPGPAIVEQMDSTIMVPPGSTATTDAVGNVLIALGGD